MIKTTGSNGFHMEFNNGWTISVQWGAGSYSDNHDKPYGKPYNRYDSNTAEIMIWNKNGTYDFGEDTVKGYISVDEVAKWINKVRKFK